MVNTTPPLKLIFKGRLEFGNQRTFDMMLKSWTVRAETYFKSDILFKPENVLDEADFSLTVPQQTIMGTDKQWRTTTALLEELAQFAVVGVIRAWSVDTGILLHDLTIEPKSDKVAVLEFRRGRELTEQEGMEDEAAQALSRAIERYENHALAYERRGYVNFKLKNFNDAHYDFSKSIDINPNNPEPFYGRGKVRMLKNDWDGAASDYEQAVKKSIALQPLYWRSRLHRGECLYHAKKFKESAAELKLFLQRNFQKHDPNFDRRRRGWFMYGKSLLEISDLTGAIDAFNMALSIKEGAEWAPEADNLLQRGICKHKAGKKEFASDLAAAAEMGSEEAAKLLVELK